jgi:L-alanine-DL-glutamate epimerase-like enolase superfamily enzyme
VKVRRFVVDAIEAPLSRPYRIAFQRTERVHIALVRAELDDGTSGFGAATPEPDLTGETFEACLAALGALDDVRSREWTDPRDVAADLARLARRAPGARAAVDMALFDAWARRSGRPLVDVLGRVHAALPTSVTIGILPVDVTLAEADEHLGRGFRALKVKVGESLHADLELLARLREHVGPHVALRVDANVGYLPRDVAPFVAAARALGIELVEQPCPPARDVEVRELAPDVRRLLVADESVHSPADAVELAREPRPYGGWNVKLMKCGGVAPALEIARTAGSAGIDLMWGCMDESAIGIAAALHAAYACRATRWLDLDGSFDLARDPARGGFAMEDGFLRPLDAPGLGVKVPA